MNASLRHLAVLTALVLAAAPTRAQTLELVDTAHFPTVGGLGGSDVWGYVAPNGTDYALYGTLHGVAVVQVPSMSVVAVVPGPEDDCPAYWRDMVVHGHYAYAVSECFGTNEGLQVIDLSRLPASVELVDVHTDGVVSSHNMDVDAGTGFLYALDCCTSGVWFIDAADPRDLDNVHYLDLSHVHDVHARNDTLYVAEGIFGTFSIWDVSEKTAPRMLTRVTIPDAGYVHNIWPTDDGRHVLTTEETPDKTVKVWDVSDMDNVALVGEYLGPSRLAHNVHVQGGYAFISHYEDGVVVLDLSDPTNPTQVAGYDTLPDGDGPFFNGNWGATTPSPGGYVYGGDFDGTLTVLQWTPPPTGLEQPAAPSETIALHPPSPNPTADRVTLPFWLAEPAHVTLTVHDPLGREVARLMDAARAAGEHAATWDGRDGSGRRASAGVYVVRLRAGNETRSRKVLLLR